MAKLWGVKVTGLKQVQSIVRELGQDGVNAFRGAMYAEGLHIIRKAVTKAPAVTGRLRNSHFVTWPDADGEVEIGFATVYAAAVEFGLKLINVKRAQQQAAWANMKESGWRKSNVGGPGYFRGAITGTTPGRLNRITKTTRRYFESGAGFKGGDPGVPNSEQAGKAKGQA